MRLYMVNKSEKIKDNSSILMFSIREFMIFIALTALFIEILGYMEIL